MVSSEIIVCVISSGGGGGLSTASSLVETRGEGETVMIEVCVTWTVRGGAGCVVSSGFSAVCEVSSGAVGGVTTAALFVVRRVGWASVMVVVRVTRTVLVRVDTASWVVCSGGDRGADAAVAREVGETVGASHSHADSLKAGVGTVESMAGGGTLGDTVAVYTSEAFADTEFAIFPPQLKSGIRGWNVLVSNRPQSGCSGCES